MKIQHKEITQHGVTFLGTMNKKNKPMVQVQSILNAFDETPGSFYQWCKEQGMVKRPAYLNTKQMTHFLQFLSQHNEPARKYLGAMVVDGINSSPAVARDAQEFVENLLEETGDRIVTKDWKHPLFEMSVFNGEEVFNAYAVASLMFNCIVFEGNDGAKNSLNSIMLQYNALVDLNALHRSLSSRLESEWLMTATKFSDAFQSICKASQK